MSLDLSALSELNLNTPKGKKLLDNLWSNLPDKISMMNLKYKDDLTGIVRFDGGHLNSIYVFVEHEEVIIFKFD